MTMTRKELLTAIGPGLLMVPVMKEPTIKQARAPITDAEIACAVTRFRNCSLTELLEQGFTPRECGVGIRIIDTLLEYVQTKGSLSNALAYLSSDLAAHIERAAANGATGDEWCRDYNCLDNRRSLFNVEEMSAALKVLDCIATWSYGGLL